MAQLFFEVNGGLGNQMFTLANAYAFAKKYKTQVILDTRGCDSGRNFHSSWQLQDLVTVLKENLMMEVRRSNTKKRVIFRKLQDQVLRLKYVEKKDIETLYMEGFDGNKDYFIPVFESRRLVEEALRLGFTQEIARLKTTIGRKNLYLPASQNSVGIHVRRTDRKNTNYEIPDSWFLKQIESIREKIDQVVCFTDSALDSQFILSTGISTKIYGEDVSPLISLLSLTEFPTLITSHSTFSFWATALQEYGSAISPLSPDNQLSPLLPYKFAAV